ncbi:MAG TPA: MMPL family transporter [Gaiellaceae bacterium]
MRALAAFSVRFRYPIIAAWIAAVVACLFAFPSLASQVDPDNSQFLSSSTPSKKAAQLGSPFQPASGSTAQLVAVRSGGKLNASDQQAISSVEASIRKLPQVTFVRDQGTSRDGQASKTLVAATAPPSGSEAEDVVDAIRATFKRSLPPGLALYLTGQVASNVDTADHNKDADNRTRIFTNIVVLIMLFLVFRSLLAPVVTLLPAIAVLFLGSHVIGEAADRGAFQISTVTQTLFTVLVIGAGTDYGLFLILRTREELEHGRDKPDAVRHAVTRVGESLASSGGTVIVALLSLLLASFGLYYGMGPALAIAIAVMLLAALTLTPALLAIFGSVLFWPRKVVPGEEEGGAWGRVAEHVIRRPVIALVVGTLFFGALAACASGYSSSGFGGTTTGPSGSQSAKGSAALAAHFPSASVNPTSVLFTFKTSVWNDLSIVQRAEQELTSQPVFKSVTGALDPNGTPIAPSQLAALHAQLGPAEKLPPSPPTKQISPQAYQAYRATSQFISEDGRTVQFYTSLSAGPPTSSAALDAIPAVRKDVAEVASRVGATDNGVVGLPATSYDVNRASNHDLKRIVPVVLALIAVLLALVLRSLVVPIYLIASVALSYFAALGLAVLIFVWIGSSSGLNFVLPFLMFIFLMALGEDYNILVMSRIREEAHKHPLHRAIARAIHVTGTTVTSAGLVLAATFAVAAVTGATTQVRQLALAIALGVLLDTFLVRTLLVPSIVQIIGRWNWWPSKLYRKQPSAEGEARARASAS